MKLEIILGIIVAVVFLGGGIFYAVSTKETASEDSPVQGTTYNANGEKQEDILVLGPDGVPVPSSGGVKLLSAEEKKRIFPVANDISTPNGFINTQGKPISISEFKGKKVVLLDIWTYSCINCIRTIPRLNELHKKYEDDGLVIIGLHTPEFAFEKVQKNVEDAVKRFDIKYPVVLDNDFSTWNAYGNRYWPRKYLIDIDGYIVYDHIGEGAYDETEKAVQRALLERNTRLGLNTKLPTTSTVGAGAFATDTSQVGSHELYFGSSRNEGLENGNPGVVGVQKLTVPASLKPYQLYLGGTWSITPEYSESGAGSTIVTKYKAKNVYLVASSENGETVEVLIDGKVVRTIFIKDEMLYTIVAGTDYKERTLEIRIKNSGFKAFAFTFG